MGKLDLSRVGKRCDFLDKKRPAPEGTGLMGELPGA
jgi:hypothetical protein